MYLTSKIRSIMTKYFLLVIAPLVVILIYLCFFAENRYVTNATVVVKQVGDVSSSATSGLGSLLGVASTNTEDIRFLQAFLQSRDLVEKLDVELDLKGQFLGNGYDPIYQLRPEPTQEELVAYFNRRVQVVLDEQTMLLQISSEGFSPEFSLKLNQAILRESELFVNDVSRRIAQEQLQFTQRQLNEAYDNLMESRKSLIAYQNKNQLFDPKTQAESIGKIVAQLEANLAQLQTEQRALLSYLNPTAPQAIAVKNQIESLKVQIKNERAKLTSPSSGNKLNQSALDFEAIRAKVEFDTDLYKLALTAYEKSRLEVARNIKKVVIITSPKLAQEALYPRIIYISFSAFLLLNLLFGLAMLISSIIREHKE